MWFRASVRHELVADSAGERQIGERPVQMPQFASTETKFDAAESVTVRRHAGPFRNRRANRFDWI
jgi:hypothetical protein